MTLKHDNNRCFFIKHPYLFEKSFLLNSDFLQTLPLCACYQFAILHNDPAYKNYQLSLSDFKKFLDYSESWEFVKNTDWKYNLRSGKVTEDRDPFIYEAIKEYDLPYYYELCDKNKSPKTGSMYFSLLQYVYPRHKRPRPREKYFWDNLNKAINYVFRNFDKADPLHWTEAMHIMPKNTSAGFVGLKASGDGTRRKKGDILPEIKRQYLTNYVNIQKGLPVEDYVMYAMRGHLSDRLLNKTRAIALVSASSIVRELIYLGPFYDQINSKDFFRNMWITGKQSLPRLNRYLRRHPEATFINTDISGWDSYRASWFHEMIMRKLATKLNLTSAQRKEYESIIDLAIRTEILLPDGSVYRKLAGIISGTAGTLLFNSLLNTIAGLCVLSMMKEYSLDIFDFPSRIRDPNWLGDDFAFFTFFSFDLEKFSKLMFKYFCVLLKPEKTIVANSLDDRKFLGYQLKGGFLYREQKELFQSLLYSERPFPKENSFAISFSRFFSYLLLGGINNYKFTEFFYFYMGKYKEIAKSCTYLYTTGMDNIFKLLKDVWNVKIETFNLETFRKMHLGILRYSLLYGYDLKMSDIIVF